MKIGIELLFGWLVPGGAYLLRRHYLQFALVFIVIVTAFAAGIALHGGFLWPGAAELQGTDGLTVLMAKGGTVAKMLAGGPYLLAQVFGDSQTFVGGRTHEFGTVLLDAAGLFNLFALASAVETESR